MKKLFLLIPAMISTIAYSQVGINTTTPQATLDVIGKPATPAVLDGIIPPRLTGVQLKAKTYTAAQTGAFVYVTTPDPSPSGQTINVTTVGTYSFDGSRWLKVNTTAPLPSSQLVLVVKGTGKQLDTDSPASNAKLAYFSNQATQTGSTIVINDPGSWDITNQMYTAPKAGVYQIALTGYVAGCTGAAGGAASYFRTIIKSGSTYKVVNTADLVLTSGQLNTNQLTTINLAAGDQVFADYNVSGATNGCSINNVNISSLSIYRFQ
ncbi:hypothetical protein CLU97_2419 [Chryseobacterium sp. 7]|uniref:hypothetical protein n=1 Tax=Chryseobacterium sp. 7 TaxID=2035214 RepID=UPI000F0E1265|nr:hypothetical protein [Chryseobacterium sp. 7]RLJ32949.1 hypothetical protein CLU97_2419 [Chryseobacterium sp. 7]